jgi:hypothetical protein
MKIQTELEKLQEQYCVGTALGILAQHVSDSKSGLQVSKIGAKMASSAYQGFANYEPGDDTCPQTPLEKFLEWLRTHGPIPPIPPIFLGQDIVIMGSAKPLPPIAEFKLTKLATLSHFNELYNTIHQKDLQAQVANIGSIVLNTFDGEVPFCGTGVKIGPHGPIGR